MSTDKGGIDAESETVRMGMRLAEERKRLGLSAEKFAEKGGVKRQAQFMYETGKRVPDAIYLRLVASEGVDVFYVLTGWRFDYVGQALTRSEQQLDAGDFDALLLREQLEALRPAASATQLARIDLLAAMVGDRVAEAGRQLTLTELARKSQLARERAARLADGGLLLEVLATAYYHGISDEGAAALAAMLAGALAPKS